MVSQNLIIILRKHFALDWAGIHGAPHWARVRENGLRLATYTGAQINVVEAFAFVHDSCRLNNGADPSHGLRAGEFARTLVREKHLLLAPNELDLLVRACEGHNTGSIVEDITICTCWDADRLDLGRIGVKPNPQCLCTDAAKRPEIIHWAYERSNRGLSPPNG